MSSKPRTILHVDMDAFFAAVEVLDNPALAGKPVIVGGSIEDHGVVAAASYPARKFGIHSAMPTATAFKLCPHAVLVKGRGSRYAEVSELVMRILASYTPQLEKASVDEAFLDVTGSEALFGDGKTIARSIKARVAAETGLTCSIGVAPNRFLAKLASDLEKPDGLTVVPAASAADFISPLPVGRIWGVGPRTRETLAGLGITTIGQLAAYPPRKLERRFGSHAVDLQALARGEDGTEVSMARETKSIGRETTFSRFLATKREADPVLLSISDDVAETLRSERLVAGTVTIKVRDDKFVTVTRSLTFKEPTDLGETLFTTARDLLERRVHLQGRKIRLLGVTASGLSPAESVPPELFPDRRTGRMRKVAETVDRIRSRYGEGAVARGRFAKKKSAGPLRKLRKA